MSGIGSVAVFCGSRMGNDPACAVAAREMGAGLARAGRRVVYGGGRVGLMGLVADAALEAGGAVLGVIPAFLTQWEVQHEGVSDLVVTDTMHSRKRHIYDAADAFVGLPGGIGTMDELVEVITWRQLRQHDKPILICDIGGSAGALVGAIEGAIAAGFSGVEVRGLFEVIDGVAGVLQRLDQVVAGAGSGTRRL